MQKKCLHDNYVKNNNTEFLTFVRGRTKEERLYLICTYVSDEKNISLPLGLIVLGVMSSCIIKLINFHKV